MRGTIYSALSLTALALACDTAHEVPISEIDLAPATTASRPLTLGSVSTHRLTLDGPWDETWEVTYDAPVIESVSVTTDDPALARVVDATHDADTLSARVEALGVGTVTLEVEVRLEGRDETVTTSRTLRIEEIEDVFVWAPCQSTVPGRQAAFLVGDTIELWNNLRGASGSLNKNGYDPLEGVELPQGWSHDETTYDGAVHLTAPEQPGRYEITLAGAKEPFVVELVERTDIDGLTRQSHVSRFAAPLTEDDEDAYQDRIGPHDEEDVVTALADIGVVYFSPTASGMEVCSQISFDAVVSEGSGCPSVDTTGEFDPFVYFANGDRRLHHVIMNVDEHTSACTLEVTFEGSADGYDIELEPPPSE